MSEDRALKDGDGIPQLCAVCERSSFLRCAECNVSYCSGACQIKNWQEHRLFHMKKSNQTAAEKETNIIQPEKENTNPMVCFNRRESSNGGGADRLMQALTKTTETNGTISKPTQNIINTQSWRSKEVEMKSNHSEEMDTDSTAAKLIKRESVAMAKMSPAMLELAKGIKKVSEKSNDAEEPMETNVDELARELHHIKISEHPLAVEGVLINEHLDRPMINIHKYDRIAPIPPSAKDFEGFFMVTVTAVTAIDQRIYSVVLNESKEDISLFKHLLNVTYNDDFNNPSIRIARSEFMKYSKALLIVKVGDQWARCRLQQGDKHNFILEDIDTGRQIKVEGFLIAKRALEPEKMKSALSFKVKFENEPGNIAVGDLLKIRLIKSNIYGISTAEVEMTKTENAKKPAEIADTAAALTWDDDENEPVTEKTPIFKINRIFVKSLPMRGKVKLKYVDGSRLDQYKMCVFESTAENELFYKKLYDDIQSYVSIRQHENNYKPALGELVLATFPDGSGDESVYRAVCVAVSAIDCKVHFIDYGNMMSMPLKNIWKMPEQFLVESVCTTVEVRLKSGKQLQNMNLCETLDSFASLENFDAFIEHLDGNKYVITIEDALITFQ